MLAIVNSFALLGMEARAVTVEVDVSNGLAAFDIVGLPDTAVKESRERVRTAIKNTGFDFPLRRITVNLAPADVRKEGAAFDLPIAIGILLATGQLLPVMAQDVSAFVGELSLEGAVRHVPGILAMALACGERGYQEFVVPAANAGEASLPGRIRIWGVNDLAEAVKVVRGEVKPQTADLRIEDLLSQANAGYDADMSEVRGQMGAKRALEIAAAGGHNLLMVGPPGSGKTMLARRLPTIMPPLTAEESLTVTRIYSVAGLLPPGVPLLTIRPFRAPHHNASSASIIGGGRVPQMGEVSLSQHGV